MISYDILYFLIDRSRGLEYYNLHYMPINQFNSWSLTMAELGSGKGKRQFISVRDYETWLIRLSNFHIWTDRAVSNFRQGIKAEIVLPKF